MVSSITVLLAHLLLGLYLKRPQNSTVYSCHWACDKRKKTNKQQQGHHWPHKQEKGLQAAVMCLLSKHVFVSSGQKLGGTEENRNGSDHSWSYSTGSSIVIGCIHRKRWWNKIRRADGGSCDCPTTRLWLKHDNQAAGDQAAYDMGVCVFSQFQELMKLITMCVRRSEPLEQLNNPVYSWNWSEPLKLMTTCQKNFSWNTTYSNSIEAVEIATTLEVYNSCRLAKDVTSHCSDICLPGNSVF